LLDVKPIYYKT